VSKILKVLTMSLLLASIMIASFAGAVFAGEEGEQKGEPDPLRNCTCEFVDCDGQGPPWATE